MTSARILVIDPDEGSARHITQAIEQANEVFDVTIAADLEEAFEQLRERRIECVLGVDELSEKSGVEMVENIKAQKPDVPFVLLTDVDDDEITSAALAAGATDVLQIDYGADQYPGLVNCLENATDQHRTQAAIERERGHRATLFENTPDPVMKVRFEGRTALIEEVNTAFEEVFGVDAEAARGRTVSDVVVPEHEREEHLSLRDEVADGSSIETTVRRQASDGLRDFRLQIIPINSDDDSGVRGAYAWYTDISEQKQHERRLEELTDASQQLLAATTSAAVGDITTGVADRVLDQPVIAMWEYDAVGEVLVPLAATVATADDDTSRESTDVIEPIESGAVEMDIFRDSELTTIDDYQRVDGAVSSASSISSVLVAPIGDYGLLLVGQRMDGGFDPVIRESVEMLCQMAAGAFERVDREQRLSDLHDVTRELVRATSRDEIAAIAAEAGETILDLSYTHVYLTDEDRDILRPVAVSDAVDAQFDELPQFQRGEGVFWDVLTAGETRLYDDVQAEAELASEMPFRGAVIAPIGEQGVFASGSMEPAAFSPFDRKLVLILAATMEVALDRVAREQQLHENERELEAARDRFRAIFEHSNDAIVIFDPEADEILEANPQASELLGHSHEELLSMGPSDIHPEEMDQFRAFLDTIRTEGSGRTDKISCLTESGESVPAEISASTLEFSGRDSVLALIRDVSELRKYERELEQKNDRLEDFASIISHDLRNPLNVAMGRVEIAQREFESEHLETAKSSLERMEEMIGDLLALTRAGESVEETDHVSLDSIVEGCWRNVDTREATLEASADMTFRADKSRLRHVLENLFRNVIEHGRSNVTIRVGTLSDDTGFYVEDDGPGIPSEDRDDVFEQGYSTTEDGTGFGLSIVKEIVEAHGWEISVTDGAEGGARFEISGVEVE